VVVVVSYARVSRGFCRVSAQPSFPRSLLRRTTLSHILQDELISGLDVVVIGP
jgi:hypothetical protein